MSELRQNLATKDWVIIASERAKRPNYYAETDKKTLTEDRAEHDPKCPFCLGNEELDLEIERLPAGEAQWQTRVVRNKYPALQAEGWPERSSVGTQHYITGVGHHEVVVEHPQHNKTLALMSPNEVYQALATYQRRGRKIAEDPRMEQIIIFKNHGDRAGASLTHSHSQIIGLPVVPGNIRHRIEEAQRYFDDMGECVFCTMVNDELMRKERLVFTNEHFVVFVLYAALSPFHMWIVPRQHRSSFLDVPPAELASLGEALQYTLKRIYFGLNDPDYNLIIRSTPVKETGQTYLHWYISIVLRLSRMAGFELGSGVYINPAISEESAAFLRDLKI